MTTSSNNSLPSRAEPSQELDAGIICAWNSLICRLSLRKYLALLVFVAAAGGMLWVADVAGPRDKPDYSIALSIDRQFPVQGRPAADSGAKSTESPPDGPRALLREEPLARYAAYLVFFVFAFHGARTATFLIWLGRYKAYRPQPALVALPSQRRVLERIKEHVGKLKDEPCGRLIGLRGDWGVGKSYVVESLRRELEHDKDCAVVFLNVWEHQREHDLHFALVRQIIRHPKVLARCLADYPTLLILAPVLQGIGLLLPKGMRLNFRFSDSALMDANLSIPMAWQESLRTVVAAARTKGLALVVIMDEIDRADPPVAQAALTMARRALDQPGLLTVVPFVEEQLRHKVFNPVNVTTPDLLGTMNAIVEQVDPDYGERFVFADTPHQLQDQYRVALISRYLDPEVGPNESKRRKQDIFFRRFAEKYVRTHHQLDGLIPGEVVAFLASSLLTRDVWGALVGELSNDDLASVMIEAIELSGLPLARFKPPSLRNFEADAMALLSELPVGSASAAVDAVAAAVVAYTLAVEEAA